MKRIFSGLFTIICLGANFCGIAQLPNTNIYSLDLRANEQKVLLNNLNYLTSFNKEGYNNQPHFINDDQLLITSDFKSMGMTDILHLDLVDHKVMRVTWTPESEYSPTAMSGGVDFSIIKQTTLDSQLTPQVLWSYPLDRSNAGVQLVPERSNVGYHVWITKDKVALYLVGDPSELLVYDIRNNTSTHIAYNIGRCLKVDKTGNLYYIKETDGKHIIRSHDIYLGRSRRVAEALEDQQDFEILPNGHLIAAKGTRLMTFIPLVDNSWKENIDLSGTGINRITRLAASRNKLALVSAE